MTSFPVPKAALMPDPEAQWWQRPTPQRPWQPVAPADLGGLPAGTQLCRGSEQRVRSVDEGQGCWCRPAGAAGPGHWVDAAAATEAWARGEELWWPGAAAWARAPVAVEVVAVEPALIELEPASVGAKPMPPVHRPVVLGPRRQYKLGLESFEMVTIPKGEFTMGSPRNEHGRHETENQVEVKLSRTVEVGIYLVTEELWVAATGKPPPLNAPGPVRPMVAVEAVTWLEAVRFCNKVSVACGLSEAYRIDHGKPVLCDFDASGFRLPTEAEWERAARADCDFRYAGSNLQQEVAWYNFTASESDGRVGRKRSNAWGIFDMSGLVFEHCWDWFGEELKGGVDPAGPPFGVSRVARGGSTFYGAAHARVAARQCGEYQLDRGLGLRLFRTVG